MKIIGGIVSYEDGIKTVAGDQFSPTRKVRVELNFSLDDGEEDTVIRGVINQAQTFVQEKLGLTTPTAAVAKTVTKTAEAAPTPKPPKAPTRPHTPKADTDELQTSTEGAGKTKTQLAAEAGLSAADDIGDLMGSGDKPKEVTDADLNDAAQKAVGRINTNENPAGPRIRALVKEFMPDPTKQPILKEIPQEKRGDFLKKLSELK